MSWLAGREAQGIDGPEGGSLDARASLVFKIMGVIGFVGILLSLIPDSFPNSALQSASFNAATGVISAIYLLEARGIDRGRMWAFAAVRPLLVVLGAWGAYAVITGFAQGKLRIPFELVMVGWAFLGPRGPIPTPRLAARSIVATGLAALMVGVLALGSLVFGWGGLLDVKPADLVASLSVDCGAAGAGPPGEITVEYDWSWSRAAPLPNEIDTLFLGWAGEDAEGHQLYIYASDIDPDPTIRSGQRGELGVALLEEARGTDSGFQWAIDLLRRGYEPGRIGVRFRLTHPVEPGTYSFTVRMAYIHLGQWRADAQPVTCTW